MAADKKRGTQTVRDMVISLTVIFLAAWVIYLFIPHDEGKSPVKTVSYGVELNTARRAAPYPVAAPVGLSEQWRATSVTYEAGGPDGAAWHLGFMTPRNEYAAVEQSDQRASAFAADVSQGAEKTAKTQRIGGEEWTRWKGPKYDALVRTETGVTTVVTGTASFDRLAELAGALETTGGKAAGQSEGRTDGKPKG